MIRYQQRVLAYLYDNFSFDRAKEIDESILNTTRTLSQNPNRGSNEKYLRHAEETFRFILFKETKHFELKIIYFVDENKKQVFVTDFFPTKMSPDKIGI